MSLPQYQCIKKVRAAKIRDIHVDDVGKSTILLDAPTAPMLRDFATRIVDQQWIDRTKAMPGWWFVEYDDGYTSASPPATFEEGYVLIQGTEPPCAAS